MKKTSKDWKYIFSAILYGQEIIENPDRDGGFIALPNGTSDQSVSQMNDLMEFITAYGVEHDVKWSAYE